VDSEEDISLPHLEYAELLRAEQLVREGVATLHQSAKDFQEVALGGPLDQAADDFRDEDLRLQTT
jgi:hypothetical protein